MRTAEIALLQEEKKPNFSLSLLQVVATQSSGSTARLAAALYFKNYIKRNWIDEDGNHKLPQNEVTAIRQELIGLMISVPANIQYQLGDAIGVIANSDFWEKWDTLVDVRFDNGIEPLCHDRIDRYLGSCFSPDTRQSEGKQWSAAGCSFNLQAVEAIIPIRWLVYRN